MSFEDGPGHKAINSQENHDLKFLQSNQILTDTRQQSTTDCLKIPDLNKIRLNGKVLLKIQN